MELKAKTIEKLKYFEGKVCTIITNSINRNFNEQIAREHFVINVGDVSSDGIWGTHPYNHELVSYFAMPHIVSIHEESILDPNNPEHARMIAEFEEKSGKKVKSDMLELNKSSSVQNGASLPVLNEKPPVKTDGDSLFVDSETLESLANAAKTAFAGRK